MNPYFKIKRENRYVRGIVGTIIPLNLLERIKILFSYGIEVVLVGRDR